MITRFETGGVLKENKKHQKPLSIPAELAVQTWCHLLSGPENETELNCKEARAATFLCSHPVKCEMYTERENAQLGF